MKYLAVLGRITNLSLAELESQFESPIKKIGKSLAVFENDKDPDINRFGGILKFGKLISGDPLAYIKNLYNNHKITLGLSDYSAGASPRSTNTLAMTFKKKLTRAGVKVRVLSNTSGALSTATVHHNQLGAKPGHIELIKIGSEWYEGLGTQNITAYARRDQARPLRDAKVGMLPPKLAQILINLCGPLPEKSTILDPFCGTGVVLQEAVLMGYLPLGADQNERMVEYSKKNLKWILDGKYSAHFPSVSLYAQKLQKSIDIEKSIQIGDATSFKYNFSPVKNIDAVAAETYLGSPMSTPPTSIKLKTEKENCRAIILGFLKNIHSQLKSGTPLALAIPAWLREEKTYSRLNILDEIEKLGYNVIKFKVAPDGLLYFREGQVVAREIIVLRKK